jgi:hypothetical protein
MRLCHFLFRESRLLFDLYLPVCTVESACCKNKFIRNQWISGLQVTGWVDMASDIESSSSRTWCISLYVQSSTLKYMLINLYHFLHNYLAYLFLANALPLNDCYLTLFSNNQCILSQNNGYIWKVSIQDCWARRVQIMGISDKTPAWILPVISEMLNRRK